jgi:hypothetical protein
MPSPTDFNLSPYYDDFSESKSFHRILFRPAFAVQARELTQSQTILQNQIEKMGNHIFESGAQMIPGEITYDLQYYSVKLTSFTGTSTLSDFVGLTLIGQTSAVEAKIVAVDIATSTDPNTLYVKYNKTGVGNNTNDFVAGESMVAVHASLGNLTAVCTESYTGSAASVAAGTYYINGYAVNVDKQTLVLDKYTNEPSYRIGLTITESFVTPNNDSTLVDNAQGSSNVNAPGAHRFKIALTLSKLALTAITDTNFIELLRLSSGALQNIVRSTEYAILEDTLARRTSDESGDYTIRTFDLDVREHLSSGDNRGIYTSGNGGLETKLALGLSPGKAYVKGYEIEKVGTEFVTIDKARTFGTESGFPTKFDVGNYVNVSNVYGSPDVNFITGETEAFKALQLKLSSPTYAAGTITANNENLILDIGRAKSKGFEYNASTGAAISGSGNISPSTSEIYKHYLFDIEMFSHIGITTSQAFTTGETLTGSSSGATAVVESVSTNTTSTISSSTAADPVVITMAADLDIKNGDAITITSVSTQTELNDNVYYVKQVIGGTAKREFALYDSSGTAVDGTGHTGAGTGGNIATSKVVVSNVQGDFLPNETVTGGTSSNTATTKTDVFENKAFTSYGSSDVKEITMAGSPTYTAQTELSSAYGENVQLSGTISVSGGGQSVVGFNSKFNTELKVGDSIQFADTGGTITTREVIEIISSSALTLGSAIGGTAVSSSIVIRRRTKLQEADKNIGIFELPYSTIKTLKTIVNSGISDTAFTVRKSFVGTLTSTGDITITANTGETFISQSEADYSVTIMTKGGSSSAGVVGDKLSTTGNQHEGDACFALSGSPVGRTLTLDFGANHQGHKVKIIGTLSKTAQNEKTKTLTSNATSTITTQADCEASTISLGKADIYSLASVKMAADFSTTPVSGDTDITDRFSLDNGQRDNFYDIGRLKRVDGSLNPTGQLLITFNYFTHGNGDFFSVDSYSGQIDYTLIPTYTSDTTGDDYRLRDCLDFRPRVDDATTINAGTQNRSYDGTGASTIDIVKFGTSVNSDHEFYKGRIDKLFLTKDGEFKVLSGAPDVKPQAPDIIDNAMHLYTISLPAYNLTTDDVIFETINNRRYTMRDIGSIEKKVDRVEYYTQLSLLETAAQSLQIQDADGFDRFKNGFIVDNFKGHGIGEVTNSDYRCSVDYAKGELRPHFNQDAVELEEVDEDGTALVDADRTAANYQKIGDCLLLPFVEKDLINQPFASKAINVNPFAIFSWMGTIELTPSSDEWRETQRTPELVVNSTTGAWDQLLREGRVPNQNEIALGTVWNEWQTNWTGSPIMDIGSQRTGSTWRHGRAVRQRVNITSINQVNQSRTGITTTAVPQTVRTSMGDRVIDVAFVPFIRSRDVAFVATRLKPNARVYPFFDNVDITSYVTPTSGSLGGNLVTDANGAVSGVFSIPDPKIDTNPRWRTGERTFRLTSSSTNSMDAAAVSTAANAEYIARGLLNTVRDTIVSTREFRGVNTTVTDQQSVIRTSTRQVVQTVGWVDPLSQTFMTDEKGGVCLSSIDLYFSTKDANIPVTVQIRNTVNGYPGSKILPFGEVTLIPSAVNTSSDASVKTTFTFPSPVYIQDQVEYSFVIMSNSNDYETYVARLGETNIGSSRTISKQPYAGVMFKSQNGSTWTAENNEDIKFTMKRCEFSAVTGTVHLSNKTLSAKTLKQNPIRTTNSSGVVRVYHKNHNLHDTNSCVTIAGVPNGTHNGIAHTDINGDYTAITNVTLDTYDVTTSGTATSSGDVGGTAVTATENRQFDVLNLGGLQSLSVPGTSIVPFVRTTTSKSIHGTQTPYSLLSEANRQSVTLADDIYFTQPQAVMSTPNETTRMAGAKSFYVIMEMSTTNPKISPIIDLARRSVFCITNRLNNPTSGNTPSFQSETAANGSSSASKYITKPVVLTNNSTALDIRLTQVVRTSAKVEVYYRTTSADEVRNINEINWTPFNTAGEADKTVTASEADDDFREYQYSASNVNTFTAFQTKIVLKGNNSSYPPIVRDMRGIALAI